MRLLIILIIGIIVFPAVNCDDPCGTTNYLDDWQRSVAFETDTQSICDNLLVEGWYRITSGAGERMPTECPFGGYRCNTVYPIYLSTDGLAPGEDVYPTAGNTVTRTAYSADYSGDCKRKSYAIKIKHCNGYFVYHLVPISGGCSSAYCFGDQLPCPSGTGSATGFTPGCKSYPDVTVTPYVRVNLHETERKNQFNILMVYSTASFECHANDLQVGYTYTTRWYVNDIEMKSAKIEGLTKTDVQAGSGRMLDQHWTSEFKPNMIVKCSMQVGGNGFVDYGPPIYSDPYFAGLKIDQSKSSDYVVSEGDKLEIPVELTMPLSCAWPKAFSAVQVNKIKTDSCLLVLVNGIPSYQTDNVACVNGISKNGIIFNMEACGVKFSHANWTEKQIVKITGQSDQLVNIADRIVFLRLYNSDKVLPAVPELSYWRNINLPDIKVIVKDKDVLTLGTSCYSYNDPHMRTFDGRYWELQIYNGLTEGEYIMYKHTRLPLQINAYFKSCWGTVLCNCGIGVRSANSIFVANFCETSYNGERRVNRYMTQRLCDDQSLIIEKTSTSYTITLPTGTKVTFSYGSDWIDGIQVIPSILDESFTTGLCGIYNGNSNDDFMPRDSSVATASEVIFAESWQVKGTFADDTLFDPEGKVKQTDYFGQQYCSCVAPDTTYPHGSPDFNCNLTAAMEPCQKTKTTEGVFTASCTTRAKRSAEPSVDEEPPSFPITVTDSLPKMIVEKWENGWTEQLATEHCITKFTSAPAYNVCSEYAPSIDTTPYIKGCIADIKSTGGDFWLKVTIKNYASACLQTSSKMESLAVTNSTNSTGFEKSVLSIIQESTCPENCSGNGICFKAACQCFPGFYGELCSVVSSQAPYVEKDAFESLCDKTKKACKTFVIPGKNFVNESSLICKFTPFSLISNGASTIVVEESSFTHGGTYSSSFYMYCKLPDSRKRRSTDVNVFATGFRISVSNNGNNYTEPLTTLVYDSICYECNITSMTCKPQDSCATQVSEPLDEPKTTTWIGVAVGAVCIILLVIGGSCVLKHKRPKKSYINDSTLSLPNTSRNIAPMAHFRNEKIFLTEPFRSQSNLNDHKNGW